MNSPRVIAGVLTSLVSAGIACSSTPSSEMETPSDSNPDSEASSDTDFPHYDPTLSPPEDYLRIDIRRDQAEVKVVRSEFVAKQLGVFAPPSALDGDLIGDRTNPRDGALARIVPLTTFRIDMPPARFDSCCSN